MDLLEGMQVTERNGSPDKVPAAQPEPRERIVFPGETLSNPPGVRGAQELINWRTGRQRLGNAVQEWNDKLERDGEMVLVPMLDANGQVIGKTYAHRPWNDAQREQHKAKGRAWSRYMEAEGTNALQHRSHELAAAEDELLSGGEALKEELLELRDAAKAGELSADEFGARFNDLLHRQRRLTRSHRVHMQSVATFNERKERGAYQDQLDVLSNHPAVQGGVIRALQTGDVPEVKLRYGHFEELAPEKIERAIYKNQKIIDELDGELARLQDRDARRGRVHSSQEQQDRETYPALRRR